MAVEKTIPELLDELAETRETIIAKLTQALKGRNDEVLRKAAQEVLGLLR